MIDFSGKKGLKLSNYFSFGNITNSIKSIINKKNSKQSNKKKTLNNLKGKFVCEAGVGTGGGIGISMGKVGLQAKTYQDITIGIENNKTYSKIAGSIYDFEIGDYGINSSYEVSFPFPEKFMYNINNPLNRKNIINNPKTQKQIEIVAPHVSSNNIFLGIDVSLHIGVGGHVKCGWDTEMKLSDVIFFL